MPKFRLMNREKTRRFDGKKEVLNFRYLDFSITGNGNVQYSLELHASSTSIFP